MPPKPTVKSFTPSGRIPPKPPGSAATATSSARGRPLTASAKGASPGFGGGAFAAASQAANQLAPGEIRPGVPYLGKLTAQERLTALERLERGVRGWDNLLAKEAPKGEVVENLSSKFAALEGEGAESGKIGKENQDQEEEEKDETVMGKVSRILKKLDDLERVHEKILNAEADRRFAEVYDCNQFARVMEKMGEATKVMENMLSVERFSEVMEVVMEPPKKRKECTLPVPFEEQEAFVKKVKDLSEKVRRIDALHRKGGVKALDLEGMVDTYGRQVESFKTDVDEVVSLQKEIDVYSDFLKRRGVQTESTETGTLGKSSSQNTTTMTLT